MPSKPGLRNKLVRTLPMRFGPGFPAVLDGRCRLAREVQTRVQALFADLGEEGLSHAQRSLVRRAVFLEMVLEGEELRISAGEGVDIAPHVALVGSLVSIYKTLGIKRQAREARLKDYLAANRAPEAHD